MHFNVYCQLENEKLFHEQSVKELEAQIKSHEGSVKGMEVMLREKEESLLESSKALRLQRQKTHKVTDKVLTNTLRFQTSSFFTLKLRNASMEIKSPACTGSEPYSSCVFSSVLAQTQLKVAEQDKQILQEQVSQLQQEVSSYSLEIVDLNERLKR